MSMRELFGLYVVSRVVVVVCVYVTYRLCVRKAVQAC